MITFVWECQKYKSFSDKKQYNTHIDGDIAEFFVGKQRETHYRHPFKAIPLRHKNFFRRPQCLNACANESMRVKTRYRPPSERRS